MSWDKKRDVGRLTGRPWRRLREQVLRRDQYLCQCEECALRLVPLSADEVDHIIALAKGGTDHPSNLRAIRSDPCHKRKTLRDSGVNVRLSRAERRSIQGDHWSR